MRRFWESMMDFLKKLNLLVQSQINDVINPLRDETDGPARRRAAARSGLSNDMARDVVTLRNRVDEALAYEDKLQKQITALYNEVSELDTKADEALRANQESQARGFLGQLHAKQRQIASLESDLNDHSVVTQELLTQVNTLEGVLEQTRREQEDQANQSVVKAEQSIRKQQTKIQVEMEEAEEQMEEADAKAEQVMETLARKVDETRRKLGELINTQSDKPLAHVDEVVDEVPPPPVHPVDRKKVDDDLASRIDRLSRRDDPDKKK
jgi:chromosome segregation ATPase